MKVSAIIMASGLSKRMNSNKLLLPFKEKKLYEHILDRVGEVDFEKIVVVSSYDEIIENAKKRKYSVVKNENNKIGKSESIKLGICEIDKDSSIMFFVADQPLLKKESINKLIEEHNKNGNITLAICHNKRRNPVIFPNYFRYKLLELKEDEGGMSLLSDYKINEVEINSVEEFMDIDTEDNYNLLRSKYEG